MHFAAEKRDQSVQGNGRGEETDEIDRTLVDTQLTRILNSHEFVRSERMARFLRHVVSSRLDKRVEQAKERIIGIEVFDRPPDWDPKIDTIVRSEARRLRSKLEKYYSASSNDDFVKVTLPKGAYYPEFQLLQVPVTNPPLPANLAADSQLTASLSSPAFPSQVKRSYFPWFALAIVMAAFASWHFLHQTATQDRSAAYEVVPFANEIGSELSPAISPNGKSIAYVWDGNTGNYDIYVKNAEGGPGTRPRRITQSTAAELSPAWSPDGRTLAYIRLQAGAASLVTLDLITGEEHQLVTFQRNFTGWAGENAPFVDLGPSWTPDGQSIVFSDFTDTTDQHHQQTHALYRINVLTAAVTRILETPRGGLNLFPRVSPNGRRIAFVHYTSHGISDLYLCNMDGSDPYPITFEKRAITGVAWSSKSDALYFTSWHHGTTRIWRISIDPNQHAELLPDTTAATDLSVSSNSERIAFTSVTENWNIWRMALDESDTKITLGPPQRFLASSGRNHGPSFSPNGKKLAFISDRSGSWQIWLADADGSNVRQLSQADGGFLGSVNWSPDSKTIAFDARPTGNSNVYLLDVAAGGVPKPIALNKYEERMPSFSADGQAVYFNSNRDGVVAVWKALLSNHSAKKVGLPGSFKALEVPSGQHIFFNVSESIYSANPDGLNATRLSLDEASPDVNWITTDRAVYFTQQNDDGQISFLAYRQGKPTLLKRIPGSLIQNTSNLAISPDHRWLLYAQRDQSTSDILIRQHLNSGTNP